MIDAFTYTEEGGRLELVTAPLMSSGIVGLVREAVLTTSVDFNGTLLNRLRMLVNHGESRSLDLLIPPGLTLVRVRRDGVDVTPAQLPGGLSIPLTDSGPGSRTSSIIVDYLVAKPRIANGGRLRPDLPRVAFPCLSFVWEVVTTSAWRATDGGPGLIAADAEEISGWPYVDLGLPARSWSFTRAASQPTAAEALHLLDERLADSLSADLTFAEWFCRFDAGPWPVVVDRIAPGGAGIGPKSQCIPTAAMSSPRNVVMATLKQHGLTLVPFSDVFVITTETELPRLESRVRRGEQFTEALVWGRRSNRSVSNCGAVARGAIAQAGRGEWARGGCSNQVAAGMAGLAVRGTGLAQRRRVCLFDQYEDACRHGMDHLWRVHRGMVVDRPVARSLAFRRHGPDDRHLYAWRMALALAVCERPCRCVHRSFRAPRL